MMNKVLTKRVMPVAVIDKVDDAVPLAEALTAGGLDIIEITFRTPAAADCVRAVRARFPNMLVGAGTLLTPEQVKQAQAAGAMFGVAPGLNEKVVLASTQLGMPFIPGVMTPSEVEKALELGCKLQKFFPAEAAGGVKMLQALSGPYGHTPVKFLPLGGVTPANMAAYLALPMVAAIGGTWIAEKQLIKEKRWADITARAAEALKLATGATASSTKPN